MLEPPEASLLDLLDRLLKKGVMANGDVTLGVAGVDLIYVRLSALLCAADRVLPRDPLAPKRKSRHRATRVAAGPDEDEQVRETKRERTVRATSRCAARGCKMKPAKVLRRHPGDSRGAARARREIERKAAPLRWNPETDDVQRSVAQLVLTIVEFLRQLMERQAIRRMEQKTLTRRRSKRSVAR